MLLTITVLVSGLFPGGELPAPVDSALTASLDSIGISREQLDFDRHWATSVGLLDSTVLSGVQNIEQLPVIMAGYIERSHCSGCLPTLPPDTKRQWMMPVGKERTPFCSYCPCYGPTRNTPETAANGAQYSFREGFRNHRCSRSVLIPFFHFWRAGTHQKRFQSRACSALRQLWPLDLGGIDGSVLSFGSSGPVRWVVGGYGSNTYHPDCRFDLIVDAGGNDLYLGGLGGAVGIRHHRYLR